jgi:hypothetical protein
VASGRLCLTKRVAVFRGVAHIHTTYSFDGRLPVAALSEFLSRQGLDFALLSEHVESLDEAKVRAFVRECAACSTESFLLIPGIEIDGLNALFYGAPEDVGEWDGWDDLADKLVAGGALTAVSHPIKIRIPIPAWTRRNAEAVEVWNSRHDGKAALQLRCVRYWRSLAAAEARALLPLCGIDFHDRSDFVPLAMEVDCPERTQTSILAALRAGRYRIVRGHRAVPLDFTTGALPASYRLRAFCLGSAHSAVYFLHRLVTRARIQPPRSLKRWLSRWF